MFKVYYNGPRLKGGLIHEKLHNGPRLKQIMSDGTSSGRYPQGGGAVLQSLRGKANKNDLSHYVSGKVEPGQDKLSILGLALGVSEAWLMGFDVSMERNVTPTAETGDGPRRSILSSLGC